MCHCCHVDVVSGREEIGGEGRRIWWQMCLCDKCYIKVVCSVADSAEEVGDLFSVTVLLAVHHAPPSLPPSHRC